MPISDQHLAEWVVNSAVSEEITRLNVVTLTDHREIDQKLQRNAKRRTKHTDYGDGGWWVSGVDPLTGEPQGIGGQFKPDVPTDPKRKYLGISDLESAPLFLDVGDRHYWQNILESTDPLMITEGAKKAGASLSAGLACVSIAGVFNGQKQGQIKEVLAKFCKVGRRIYLGFDADQDKNLKVRKALDQLGRLIAELGSVVRVLQLPQETKGIDDYAAKYGHAKFLELVEAALPFETWRKLKRDKENLDKDEQKSFIQIATEALYGEEPWICVNDLMHKWTGTHYAPSPDSVERRRIWQFCNEFESIQEEDYDKIKITYKYAAPGNVNRILDWVKQGHSVNPILINPPGLNLANGVLTVYWQKGKPKWRVDKHDPALYYNYISQVKYDPEADPELADKLLIALDDDQRDIFLKTIAAALDLPTIRMKLRDRIRALLLKGDGSNGKDTLREAVSEIFSQGLTGCTFKDFSQYDEGRKFPLSKLAYSRINWASENHSNFSLDKLQSLKSVITGDPIDIEAKNQDEYTIKPSCVLLLNCNEAPSILAAQEAIATRYCFVKFNKTFKSNPNLENGELPVDPRFKNDPTFLQQQVCPSLLNKILDALSRLVEEGINYKKLDSAIDEIRKESSHLLQWADEIGLEYGKGRIKIGDLYESLKDWYVSSGMLEVNLSDKGKEKLIWMDEGNKYDPLVKAPRLMKQAIAKIFPKAKFSVRTEDGFFAMGVQSKNFLISPNFGSFDSGEKENTDLSIVSEMNQNNFASGNGDFASGNMNQISNEPNEASKNGHEPNKPIHSKASAPNEANEAKVEVTRKVFTENNLQIQIGDRVIIANKIECLQRYPKMKSDHQTATWEVKQIKDGIAICVLGRDRYDLEIAWLYVLERQTA